MSAIIEMPKRDLFALPRYTLREATQYLHWRDPVDYAHIPTKWTASFGEIPAIVQGDEELLISFHSLVTLFSFGYPERGDFILAGVANHQGANETGITCGFSPEGTKVSVFIREYRPREDKGGQQQGEPLPILGRQPRWPATHEGQSNKQLAERIDYLDESPVRIYPLTRRRSPSESPRAIAIDPRYGFGRPIFANSGIRIDAMTGRFWAGESVADIAIDTEIPATEIEEAIRFESLYRPVRTA